MVVARFASASRRRPAWSACKNASSRRQACLQDLCRRLPVPHGPLNRQPHWSRRCPILRRWVAEVSLGYRSNRTYLVLLSANEGSHGYL